MPVPSEDENLLMIFHLKEVRHWLLLHSWLFYFRTKYANHLNKYLSRLVGVGGMHRWDEKEKEIEIKKTGETSVLFFITYIFFFLCFLYMSCCKQVFFSSYEYITFDAQRKIFFSIVCSFGSEFINFAWCLIIENDGIFVEQFSIHYIYSMKYNVE